jgi:cob(I)alamin adenosyltransferase
MSDDDKGYSDPKLAINRVYTKKGDAGKTALVGGQKVDKDAVRIEAYGTVDELNAFVGAARQSLLDAGGLVNGQALEELSTVLLRVQHELFNLGSILATLPEDVHPKQPKIGAGDVTALEEDIDRRNAELEPLRSFVLPGGHRTCTDLHVCRTICRRAERACVRLGREESVDPLAIAYLNRLGDAFFVWSRWVPKVLGVTEVLWEPNVASSAKAP